MDWGILASIVIALIGAGTGIASQRAAAKALIKNTQTSSRMDSEKEAYMRARRMDIETIERQDEEIGQLREENGKLKTEIRELKDRCLKLERLLPKQGE